MAVFKDRTDSELLDLMRSGDTSATSELVARYARQVRACARPFSLVGWDQEDFIQEGMIGLLRGLDAYDPKLGPFSAYVSVCVRRQLLNTIRRGQNSKNAVLNDYISFDAPIPCDEGHLPLGDTLTDTAGVTLEEQVLSQVFFDNLKEKLAKTLSSRESSVLIRYLAGDSISEISRSLGISPKSVDNTVTRIKRKAADLLSATTGR